MAEYVPDLSFLDEPPEVVREKTRRWLADPTCFDEPMVEAAPDGYSRPDMYGPMRLVPLLCDLCGAAVSALTTERHTDWHRRLGG